MKRVIFMCTCLAATAVAAHQGVQNPTVKARMDNMSAIAENVKTLGSMAKGQTTFDQASARDAALAIATHAVETTTLFQDPATDPKSEARAEIWENFEDFTAKADELEMVARPLSNSISVKADLGVAMRDLGATCKSCHADYRK